MLCGHCDKPILELEAYTTHDIPSPSGPGTTVHRHVFPCRPDPRRPDYQTPATGWRQRR